MMKASPPAARALVFECLRAYPPHEDWTSFVGMIELNRGLDGDRADQLTAILAATLRTGATHQIRGWLRIVSRCGGAPSADLHAVRARLEVAWRVSDPLQRDALDILVSLAELAEAAECGMPTDYWRFLMWLVDPARPPRWDPMFATAVASEGAPSPSMVAAEIEKRAESMPRAAARVQVDLAAAMRATAGRV
jgi:hypothetical protein